MTLEAWHLLIAIAGVSAAFLPILLRTGTRIRDIATWRQSVDDGLAGIKDDSKESDAVLHKRLDSLERQLERHQDNERDMATALRELAEVAGRALGRTEGKD